MTNESFHFEDFLDTGEEELAESKTMDPFDLADHQIHTIVDEHAPDQQYPTYEEDAARGLEIERARRVLVREALRSPFILRKVAHIQQKVYEGTQQRHKGKKSDDPGLSFSRLMRLSETEGITEESAERSEFTEDAIKERMQHSLPQLLDLITCDDTDRMMLLRKNISAAKRPSLRRTIAKRENAMIDTAYAMPVRMDKVLTPLLKMYGEKERRMEEIRSSLSSLPKDRKTSAQEIVQLQEELQRLSETLLQTPDQCRKTSARIRAAHERYAKSLHALVEPHLRIVLNISNSFHKGKDWNKMEFRSAGFIGLMRAAELYEHRKGFKFNTYAQWWVRQAIRREQPEVYNVVHIPPHAGDAIRAQTKAFQEKYYRLPLEKSHEDISLLSEGSGFSEEMTRSILALRHVGSLNSVLRSRRNGEDGSALGDIVPDEKQPSPLALSIEREMEDHVHEILRSTPLFHRIMFKLRRGLRLRDYELPGKEYPWLIEAGRCLGLCDYQLPDPVKIFPERSLVRILIKIRNGFPLTKEEALIFDECNNTKDKRAVGLPSVLGPAEQLEDPPEGYLGSLNVDASKANHQQGKPSIIETVPIFDHAEKNNDKEAGYTLEVVATICGITRERVRQLEKKLMQKLQDPTRIGRLKILLSTDEQEEPEHSGQE